MPIRARIFATVERSRKSWKMADFMMRIRWMRSGRAESYSKLSGSRVKPRAPGSHRIGHAASRPVATLQLESTHDIEEWPAAAIRQVGQIIREVGEVVASAQLDVFGEMTVEGGEQAGAGVMRLMHGEPAAFEHRVPFTNEVQIGPDDD